MPPVWSIVTWEPIWSVWPVVSAQEPQLESTSNWKLDHYYGQTLYFMLSLVWSSLIVTFQTNVIVSVRNLPRLRNMVVEEMKEPQMEEAHKKSTSLLDF